MKKLFSLITAISLLALCLPVYADSAEEPTQVTEFVGFESTFDNGFEEDGWTKSDAMQVEVDKDGRLKLWGNNQTDYIMHGLDENSGDIIYVSFEMQNTATGALKFSDGIDTQEIKYDRFNMLSGNPAGAFVRDADHNARRFQTADNYWSDPDTTHKYEIIYNFKDNEQKLYIDNVEASYYNSSANNITANGGVTVRGTALGDVYFFLTNVVDQYVPIYLDNVIVKRYPTYLEEQIAKINVYDANASATIEPLKPRIAYLDTIGEPISTEAKSKIELIESLSDAQDAFTPSLDNTYLIGAMEMFTLNDGITPKTIEVNGQAITENVDYYCNGNKYLFLGTNFSQAGTVPIVVTAQDDTKYLTKVDIREAKQKVIPVSDATQWIDGSNVEYVANWISGYYEDANKVLQVCYNPNASVTWNIGSEFAGRYKVEWFDINATHPNNNQYQQPSLNFEVKSTSGKYETSFNTTRDNSWHDMGTYIFAGNGEEYVKFSNATKLSTNPGERFFTECIRLTEVYDDEGFREEVLTLPGTLSISEGDVAGISKVVTVDESIKDRVDGIYIDGEAVVCDCDGNGRYLIPDEKMTEDEHSVYALVDGVKKTNTVTFTLIEPMHIAYGISQATKGVGVTETAGSGHSRNGVDAPAKKTMNEDGIIVPPEGTDLDDYIWVKWDIGTIAEGDYLVDAWLTKGYLAAAVKAEVVSNGGATTKVYHSLHANNHTNETPAFYTEAYFGNGEKIHFTGNGQEYIKIMLDDDYEMFTKICFLFDSIRLTPWYDMNSIYDEFYGDNVIELEGEPKLVKTEPGADGKDNTIYNQEIKSKYKMSKYGYTAFLALYDTASGKLLQAVKQDNIILYDGDNIMNTRYALGDSFDATGKTFKVFLWGGDEESMKPYLINVDGKTFSN